MAFAVNVATLAATPFSHSGNSTTSQMDELLIKSWSSDIMCKCPPAKPIVSGPSLSAPHHKFISSVTSSSSQEIGFSPCVRLQLWMRFALLTGSAGWPDCCLVSKACSHMSAVQLTHPLFCTSSIWQDPFCLLFFDCYSFLLLLWARFFFLFLFCVYSLATHHPTVPMTVDRWLVDAGKRTCSWSLPKMLFCRWIKCETRTRMQKKKRKKNSDSECCEIYFFSSTLLPESVLPHYSGWALRETPHVCLDQTSDRTHDRVFCSQCDRHVFVPLVLSTESAPKQWG